MGDNLSFADKIISQKINSDEKVNMKNNIASIILPFLICISTASCGQDGDHSKQIESKNDLGILGDWVFTDIPALPGKPGLRTVFSYGKESLKVTTVCTSPNGISGKSEASSSAEITESTTEIFADSENIVSVDNAPCSSSTSKGKQSYKIEADKLKLTSLSGESAVLTRVK